MKAWGLPEDVFIPRWPAVVGVDVESQLNKKPGAEPLRLMTPTADLYNNASFVVPALGLNPNPAVPFVGIVTFEKISKSVAVPTGFNLHVVEFKLINSNPVELVVRDTLHPPAALTCNGLAGLVVPIPR